MTTETSQPTCTICGRLRGYGPPCCDWNLHIGTMSNEVEHWRLGYERENLRANEEHAVRMQLEAAHATLMREALARAEAAESASFDAEERTEEYRRLVETRDEAIAALDAGIGKDVEVVRLAAALAQEKDAREAAEKALEIARALAACNRREIKSLRVQNRALQGALGR